MTVVYRTDDLSRWGSGKGSNLQPNEVDLNFWEVVQQITDLSSSTNVGIDYITQDTSNTFTIHLTDHTTQGPFNIPSTTWTPRGNWTPNTVYAQNDVVIYNGTTYLVAVDHVSADTFDPNLLDGSPATLVYGEIVSSPGNSLPTGGTAGQALVKVDDADFNVRWLTTLLSGLGDVELTSPVLNGDAIVWSDSDNAFINQPVPLLSLSSPLNDGDVLVWSASLGAWINRQEAAVQTQTSSTWTPLLADAGTYNRFTFGGTTTVSIEPEATTDFAVGTEIHCVQASTGAISFEGLSGVIINVQDSCLAQTSGQGAVVTLKKVGSDEWDLFGRLEPSSP